jgi:hypothetical protein
MQYMAIMKEVYFNFQFNYFVKAPGISDVLFISMLYVLPNSAATMLKCSYV